jgi:hypothetical protein
MWMEKLWGGLLRVLTPLGPRYLKPTFFQRVYLLWIFRNFQTLPVKVLSPIQLQFMDAMCRKQGFAFQTGISGFEDVPILGTLEQRPPADSVNGQPPRRPSASVSEAVSPFAANEQGS